MRKLIQENKVFFIGYLLILMTVLSLFGIFGKEDCFLFVNSNYSTLGDTIFPYITHFGDGITIVIFTLILLFFSYRMAIQSGMIYIISSQITQILKRTVFKDIPRPSKYFEGLTELHFVDGVEIHKMMSFPSGHTTSVFAFMAFLSIITKNKLFSILYLLMAIFAAYSRMYLAQHFLEDVITGSIIGVVTAFVVTTLLNNFNWFQSIPAEAALFKSKK
jgi:membrane-associated phospholipid phosphatase